MHEPPDRHSRLFTLDEAQALLPELRRLFAQYERARAAAKVVAALLEEMEAQRSRANTLELARPLRERREQLGEHAELMRAAIGAVLDLGVEVKHLDPALVDFPSIRDGRVVYLCWQEDEDTIAYWHDLNTGFAGRTPL